MIHVLKHDHHESIEILPDENIVEFKAAIDKNNQSLKMCEYVLRKCKSSRSGLQHG